MTISIIAEKSFDKNQNSSIKKRSIQKNKNREEFPQVHKKYIKQLGANFTFNDERLKISPTPTQE